MLLLSSGVSDGAPTTYREQNFPIELPTDWHAVKPPAESLALVRSPDGSKGLTIMVSEFSAQDRAGALGKMVAGAKKSAAKQGVAIGGSGD